jgi:hypothetical protein
MLRVLFSKDSKEETMKRLILVAFFSLCLNTSLAQASKNSCAQPKRVAVKKQVTKKRLTSLAVKADSKKCNCQVATDKAKVIPRPKRINATQATHRPAVKSAVIVKLPASQPVAKPQPRKTQLTPSANHYSYTDFALSDTQGKVYADPTKTVDVWISKDNHDKTEQCPVIAYKSGFVLKTRLQLFAQLDATDPNSKTYFTGEQVTKVDYDGTVKLKQPLLVISGELGKNWIGKSAPVVGTQDVFASTCRAAILNDENIPEKIKQAIEKMR